MKDRYGSTEQQEQNDIFNSATWVLKSDYKHKDIADDGQSALLDSLYSCKQRFGYIDYQDHRKDSLDMIKNALLDSNKDYQYQRIHLYKDVECNQPLKTIICWGYLGGISAKFVD